MDLGNQLIITKLDPADAAKVLVIDDEHGVPGKRPLTDFPAGSFFSTEW
jgi:hypothetical protein